MAVTTRLIASVLRSSFVSFALPPLLYATAIISVSSIPDLSGPELPVIPFDKTAHLLEYCIFGLLTLRATTHFLPKNPVRTAYLVSLFVVACMAGFDEWYQSFIPGRSSDFHDFLADFAGGLLAIAIFALWRRRKTGR